MAFSKIALFALFSVTATVRAIDFASSKHNIYLSYCKESDCLLDFCDSPFLGASLFTKGPASSTSSAQSRPDVTAHLSSQYGSSWAGSNHTIRLGRYGQLTTAIQAGTVGASGSIAGVATLGTEPFVCFQDGTTRYTTTVDADDFICTTQYWCPSLDESPPTVSSVSTPRSTVVPPPATTPVQ